MEKIRWMKIRTTLLADPDIRQVRLRRRGDDYLLVWLQLVALSCRLGRGGCLCDRAGKGLTVPYLGEQVCAERPFLRRALALYEELGMLCRTEEDVLCVRNWERYV